MAELADLSEHNGYLPGGQDGYIIRTVSDGGAPRQDYKWRQWHSQAAGRPRGAYGIFYPGRYSPVAWADAFIATLRAVPWEIVPTVDVELGDANACRDFCAAVAPRIRAAGFPVVMGYYSALSAYRQTCAGLFDRQWIAIYGNNDGTRHAWPSGADMHQYSSNPYDKNYIPDIGRILSVGVAPSEEDDFDVRSNEEIVELIAQGVVKADLWKEEHKSAERQFTLDALASIGNGSDPSTGITWPVSRTIASETNPNNTDTPTAGNLDYIVERVVTRVLDARVVPTGGTIDKTALAVAVREELARALVQ